MEPQIFILHYGYKIIFESTTDSQRWYQENKKMISDISEARYGINVVLCSNDYESYALIGNVYACFEKRMLKNQIIQYESMQRSFERFMDRYQGSPLPQREVKFHATFANEIEWRH